MFNCFTLNHCIVFFYCWYLMVFFPKREQMSLILHTGNICIPDKSMIKDSTDHHLQTIQHAVIWPGAVYSGRHIHTHTWHSSHCEAGSFTARQGGLDTTYCFSVLITRTRNQKGRRFTFTKTAECTHTHILLQSPQNNATTIQAQHLFQSESGSLPESCSKTK